MQTTKRLSDILFAESPSQKKRGDWRQKWDQFEEWAFVKSTTGSVLMIGAFVGSIAAGVVAPGAYWFSKKESKFNFPQREQTIDVIRNADGSLKGVRLAPAAAGDSSRALVRRSSEGTIALMEGNNLKRSFGGNSSNVEVDMSHLQNICDAFQQIECNQFLKIAREPLLKGKYNFFEVPLKQQQLTK